MNESQARRLMFWDSALRLIAARGCENYTAGNCYTAGRTETATYGADQVCAPCIARAALDAE